MSYDVLQHKLRRMRELPGSYGAVIDGRPEKVPVRSGSMIHYQNRRFSSVNWVARDLDVAATQNLQKSLFVKVYVETARGMLLYFTHRWVYLPKRVKNVGVVPVQFIGDQQQRKNRAK